MRQLSSFSSRYTSLEVMRQPRMDCYGWIRAICPVRLKKQHPQLSLGVLGVAAKISPLVREKFFYVHEMLENVQDSHDGGAQETEPPHNRGDHADHSNQRM